MLRLVLLCILACTLLLAACGGDDDSESAATPTATEDSGPAPLDSAKTYVATVSTSMGDFEITLDSKQAPKTGGSFKSLADKGFYDKLTFHRVVPGFVIQGGDPNGDGTGGPDYSVEEAPPQDLKYTKGVVAMAKTQDEPAGTSGSQFFVVTANDAQLPPDYALLGKVTSGQDVVDKIGRVKTDDTEKPVKPVSIKSIKVSES
jgi:peptidyl-prolyl cis-trans isomerase B (cyclophilin B)